MGERVIVAMSGGVDSSVAAARLHDAGYEVVGVTLHLWDYPDDPDAKGAHGRCCAPEDQYDARRVADFVGFPHFTFDRRDAFRTQVVEPFVDAYLAGPTPSPCTTCNRSVKLGELLALAKRLGATKVATGHFARIERDETGRAFVAEAVDRRKDQSYFLYSVPEELVEMLVFPLGESTKDEVRAEAVARSLPGATKGESQELCFVGQGAGAYAKFVEERAGDRRTAGTLVDEAGKVLGRHEGIHKFTVGQRKGLGVALGHPAFVTRIDGRTGVVVLGSEEGLAVRECSVEDACFSPGVTFPFRARVRVRYRHEGAPAIVRRDESGEIRVVFDEPVRAVTTGQVAVFYDPASPILARVYGGGKIVAHA